MGFYFDTVVTMQVYTDDEDLLTRAQAECQRYDDLLSKTHEGSDVWNINHAQGERVSISPETREILEKALVVDPAGDYGLPRDPGGPHNVLIPFAQGILYADVPSLTRRSWSRPPPGWTGLRSTSMRRASSSPPA